MTKLVCISIALVLVSSLNGCRLGCDSHRERVAAEITKANYCIDESDCMVTSVGCPFGCGNLVNRKEESRLLSLARNYQKTCGKCFYDCAVQQGRPKCVARKCQKVAENRVTRSYRDGSASGGSRPPEARL